MFYDQVEINVTGGNGGRGAVAFRREKYVPFGGPSGGDGGRGGDVILAVNPHMNTLYHLARVKDYCAGDGENGRNKDQYGAGGSDLELPVPPGTVVYHAKTGEVLADLDDLDDRVIVAKGGKGGRGNIHFATATNKAPRIAEKGDLGESCTLRLELKLIADVGLVGKPNAGKSTLLSVTTAATPQIAPYPFTTLQPNLGVVALTVNETFVMADLPGLIEGASEGKGLGLEFLRHIERTRVLIHLIDATALDPYEDFQQINYELKAFGHGLTDKPQIIVLNKLDAPGVRDLLPDLRALFSQHGYHDLIAISALTRENIQPLMWKAYEKVQQTPVQELHRPRQGVLRFEQEIDDVFTIKQISAGIWRVSGDKIEKAVQRTQTQYYESLLRLHGYLEYRGVIDALRDAGIQEGDTVQVADYEFEWRDEQYE
ncbi:MAG: GTPase ObgE [Anaerolineae bacterium]|nr:GTPase ObgE [Anaerolineae bacterium]